MVRKGSITIYLTLMLGLILALVCTSIESVRMAAARTQILCGLDIGLYSLFGQYDKLGMKEYDLFFIDGSCGGGTLKMANVYHNMESYMEPVLKQNSQKLSLSQGGFTGYQLLTDENGDIFYHQVLQYMKDTIGIQGAQLLLNRFLDRQRGTEEALRKWSEIKDGNALESYESAITNAEKNSQELEKRQQVVPKKKKKVTNPITTIKRIMQRGILELVLPSDSAVSDRKIKKKILLSNRQIQSGMAMPHSIEVDFSYLSQFIFQQYLMQKLGNYHKPAKGDLAYQIEYMIGGKYKDKDNLKAIAEQLLLIREGVNLASLVGDPVKMGEIETLSLAIASSFLVPPAAGVIQSALILCWSFAESILDVRELFSGGHVPLVKENFQWQISLKSLPDLLNGLDTMRRNDENGLSYEDYLQILLLTKSRTQKVKRGMDMIELSIREKSGNQDFRLDSGIVAVEASVNVMANRRKTFSVTRQYCYD